MNRFQKFATAALVSVIVLIFVGAVVRVSGTGMGCPDWPRCWGRLIPPTRVEQVDLSKLDFEKFRKAAKRYERDPATVTPEHILENFNAVHSCHRNAVDIRLPKVSIYSNPRYIRQAPAVQQYQRLV